MSLPHWSYVAMLVFCLAGTLPLVPAFRLHVLRQRRRLALTILLAGTPFVVWDLYATHAGHWWFDAAQTPAAGGSPGLPLEEVAFFVVIPLVSVLTFEAVRAAGRRQDRRPRDRSLRAHGGVVTYTALAVVGGAGGGRAGPLGAADPAHRHPDVVVGVRDHRRLPAPHQRLADRSPHRPLRPGRDHRRRTRDADR